MNILVLAREIPYPADSGVKMRAWLILRHLAQSHDVTLVCYAKENESCPKELLETCESVHLARPSGRKGSAHDYLKMFLGLFSHHPSSVKSRYSSDYDDKVRNLLERKRMNLVVCDSLYQAHYVREGDYKTLLSEHNIESVIIARYANLQRNLLLNTYAKYELSRMKRFEENVWSRFDLTLVCSEVDRREVEGRSNAKQVVVVHNGVDLVSTRDDDEEPNSLIYSGLIGWWPNEDAVSYFHDKIYPLIKRVEPQVRWNIVGKGPSQRVVDLTQDGSITVTGYVDDVSVHTSKAAVVIVPLRVGSGTRLKVLEALAMKKAVVSTSIGCEGLEVTHGKDILVADSAEHFSKCVIELLKDPKKRIALGANGRKLVEEKYSYDVVGTQIGSIVEAL